MEHVLISGGAGFVGSHLVDAFLTCGFQVIVVDNLLTGTLQNLAHLKGDDRLTVLQQDCAETTIQDIPLRYVLHFACPASPIDYQRYPLETMAVCSQGTQRLLEIARAHGARFLLASTSEIYGDPLEHPQRESYYGNVNTVGPRSVYDESKRFAETLTVTYHRVHGVDTGIVRIFNTYGPRMRLDDGRAIPTFIYQALTGQPLTINGDGTMTRSFCYVSDLVDGLVRLVMSDVHDPVNLGNPGEYTVLELAEHIIAATGSDSNIVYQPAMQDDPKVRRPDISRAKALLGWEPTIALEDGLTNTITALREGVVSLVNG